MTFAIDRLIYMIYLFNKKKLKIEYLIRSRFVAQHSQFVEGERDGKEKKCRKMKSN